MTGDRRSDRVAQLLLVLMAAFFGGTWVAAPWATDEIAPLTVAFLRFLAAAILLFGWCRATGIDVSFRRADLPVILGVAFTSIVGYNILFLYGVTLAPPSHGAVIVPGLIPAATLVIGRIVFGEPIGARRAAGIAVSLVGLVLVVGPSLQGEGAATVAGEAMFAASAVLWATYTLVGRAATRRFHVAAITFLGAAAGALILLPLAILQPGGFGDLAGASIRALGGVLYLATFGTVLSFVFFYEGIRRLGAARASAFTVLIPLFGASMTAVLLDEPLGPLSLVGAAIVIAGLVITQRSTGTNGDPA
jgi:drug/metabolite transporter (DMT)-like permease